MDRAFYFEIVDYAAVSQRQFFGEHKDVYQNLFGKHQAIYCIAKIPPTKFIVDSFRPVSPYSFVGDISIAGQLHSVTIDLASRLYSNPKVREAYFSKRDMALDLMHRRYGQLAATAEAAKFLYNREVTIDYGLSRGDCLYISDPLSTAISKETGNCHLVQLFGLINKSDIPSPSMEILYLGQSSDVARRINRHNKWGEITANINPDEEIIIYAYQVRSAARLVTGHGAQLAYHQEMAHNIKPKDAITLLEMSIIRYFQPRLNDIYKETDLTGTKEYKRWLKDESYSWMSGIWGVHGGLGQAIGSAGRPQSGAHKIRHGLRPWSPSP